MSSLSDLKTAVLEELQQGTHTEAFADGARFALQEAQRMLPTREQIAEAIDPEPERRSQDDPWVLWVRRREARDRQVDAVLALLVEARS